MLPASLLSSSCAAFSLVLCLSANSNMLAGPHYNQHIEPCDSWLLRWRRQALLQHTWHSESSYQLVCKRHVHGPSGKTLTSFFQEPAACLRAPRTSPKHDLSFPLPASFCRGCTGRLLHWPKPAWQSGFTSNWGAQLIKHSQSSNQFVFSTHLLASYLAPRLHEAQDFGMGSLLPFKYHAANFATVLYGMCHCQGWQSSH